MSNIKSFLDFINENEKLLGKGEEGACYLMDDGNIKKVFHRGIVPVSYQLLYQASNFVSLQTLPKVTELNDDYIVREPVKPKTPLCRKYYKIATTYKLPNGMFMYKYVMNNGYYDPDKDLVVDEFNDQIEGKDEQTVWKWLYMLKYELSQIKGANAQLGDFGLQNFGETNDGKVIMFDF